jgi:pantetheine-phosphate adenylyltransferase/dephospho-CoA kinase
MSKKTKAIVPFTGDPIHKGHVDLIRRASKKYGQVTVGFGKNPGKSPLFTLKERVDMAMHELKGLPNVDVVAFPGMMVDYAYEQCISPAVKGIRNSADKEYEKQLEMIGDSQELPVKTVYLKAKPDHYHVASSNVKAIMKANGMVHKYVSLYVKQRLEARINGQYIVAITGEPGSGKSYIGKKLAELGNSLGIPVYNVELDEIGHEILSTLKEPRYVEVRNEIASAFGKSVRNQDGSINRKNLGEIVFNDPEKLEKLNEIMYTPLRVRLRRALFDRKGLFIINAALIAESDMSHFSNNNTVLVYADENTEHGRLKGRHLSDEQIERRLKSQYSFDEKREKLESLIARDDNGKLWVFNNSNGKMDSVPDMFNGLIKSLDIYGELRFAGMWERLKADGTYDEEYAKIVQTYSTNNRYYHDICHIVSMVNEWESCKHMMKNPDAVLFSIYFHDYVMKRSSKVDEERSANHAYAVAKQLLLSEEFAKEVHANIMVTKHNIEPLTEDQKLMIDLDLSIFGKPWEVFNAYDTNIWNEWQHVGEAKFKEGRKKVLEGFYQKAKDGKLYQTDFFREKYQKQALENLERAIKKYS